MHKKTLQNLFSYRKREEVLAEIQSSWKLNDLFISWNEEQKEAFLDICTGQRGVKILFDSFFKEVFNPEYNPQRLSQLLSLLLKKKVRVLKVLPNDTTRITVEPSFLITDIVVEFEDGSIANIEVQKIGYRFPGERAVTPQTFFFASTSASKTVIPKTSITKTSGRFMSSFFLNTVQKNFMRFRIPTCIRFTRFPTQNWK